MVRDVWEYKTITVTLFECRLKDKDLDANFQAIGKEGWELVAVTPIHSKDETISLIHSFKRLGDGEPASGPESLLYPLDPIS